MRIGSDAGCETLDEVATVYEKRICTSCQFFEDRLERAYVGISFETGALFIRYWLTATPSLP